MLFDIRLIVRMVISILKVFQLLTSNNNYYSLYSDFHTVSSQLIAINSDHVGCVCPGDSVQYECTVCSRYYGPGLTVWIGSAVMCNERGNANEIVLVHSRFSSDNGTSIDCSEGRVTVHIIGVVNNCYISQISLTVSEEIINKTIGCLYDNGIHETIIGQETITALNGKLLLI